MLILTRRPGQSIRIGDDIELTVEAVKGNQVRFNFRAPKNVVIDREEVYERKKRERAQEASCSSS